MNAPSVRIRLLLTGALALFIVLGLTGFGLTYLFKRHVERRIGAELDTYITHIASHLSADQNGQPQLDDELPDPRFGRIYSGLYWQVENEKNGLFILSRSLWDIHLSLPKDRPPIGKIDIHFIEGPQQSRLLVHERRLKFLFQKEPQVFRLSAAIDLAELNKASADFAEDVSEMLFLLGFVLLLAGWFQIKIGLEPLRLVEESISAIRSGAQTRIGDDLPLEVLPLGLEINRLLEAQEQSLQRARHRAADLAHGFKTPLTALNEDIRHLREKGEKELANNITTLTLQMQRQIEHQLTRTRLRDMHNIPPCKVAPIIAAIRKTLQRTPDGQHKNIEISCPEHSAVYVNEEDLHDLLGNLMENALKHAVSRISVSILAEQKKWRFLIEDDGKGVSTAYRELVKKRGMRLDRSANSSGLGLAIVSDILEIYGERLELGPALQGGLQARFSLPHVPPAADQD